jgi:hypothetical protein
MRYVKRYGIHHNTGYLVISDKSLSDRDRAGGIRSGKTPKVWPGRILYVTCHRGHD